MMKVGRNGMPNNTASPCFVMKKKKIEANLDIFKRIGEKTNIVWIYTLKAFHEKEGLTFIANALSGFSVGNLAELSIAKALPYQHLHSYSPAFDPREVNSLAKESSTMSFNSLSQWRNYQTQCSTLTSLGLRINPKLSLKQPAYCDASSQNSRFGIAYDRFVEIYQKNEALFEHLEGLHFHAFCHQDLAALELLLVHISKIYKDILPKLKWLNLGGGQDFTSSSYDLDAFIILINAFQKKYPHLTLYFEPGSTVVSHTGYFKCSILDIIEASPSIAILNTSIETHLLDLAITKQTLKVRGASKIQTPYIYELAGVSCIAGDILGTYYFDTPLQVGDTVIFEDMMGYTLVKQTEFNGIKKAKFYIEE